MLEQQLQPEESAAQIKVSPQELTEAISSLEQKLGMGGDKIGIGEAINQLGLDATPEDVLREIVANREAKLARAAQRNNRRKVLIPLLFAAIPLLLSMVLIFSLQSARVAPPAMVAPTANFIADVAAPPMSISTEETPAAEAGQTAGTLADMQDGSETEVDLDTIFSVNQGKKLTEISVSAGREASAGFKARWRVVKLGGKLYVRGYERPVTVVGSSGKKYNFVSSSRVPNQELTPKTVPIEKLKGMLDPVYRDEIMGIEGLYLP